MELILNFFNIYGSGGEYLAFDSITHNLEVLYFHGDAEKDVANWNPTPPPPSMFTAPIPCYPTPMFTSSVPNPLAPAFPNSMTMYSFDGFSETVIYYDGVNQMWRIDTDVMTILQRGNMAYLFLNAESPSTPLINPLPCYSYANNYAFIPGIPSTFSTNLGTATYNGVAVTLWAAQGQIWYWDSTNTPQFFFGGPVPSVISYFQPGAPPPGVFDPPAFCMPSTSKDITNKLRFPQNNIFFQHFTNKI